MNPPGRFLKQDAKTKLWSDIGEKKALDKTRQALREGAPELLKELEGGPGGDGTGGNNEDEDHVAPLQFSGTGHPLTDSLTGNISLGSFSLGNSFNTSGLNTSLLAGSTASFNVPHQVGASGIMSSSINSMGMYDSGTSSILAAAAQIQAQQQQQQRSQPAQSPNTQAEWDAHAQLQLLKHQMQMNPQQANVSAAQQHQGGGGGIRNDQNNGFNAMLAAAQAGNSNMANNEMTALLAMMQNNASKMNNSNGMGMGNLNAYQQQLAQMAMFNQMNNSGSTLRTDNRTGNIRNDMSQMNNHRSGANGNRNNDAVFGNDATKSYQAASFGSFAQQHQQQQPPQHEYQDTSIPLKLPSSSIEGNNNLRGMRGSALNSSFTRSQRIGLKNSFTSRRPNRHLTNSDLHSSLKNSLMSIESLTLDDIDASDFSGANMEGVFEDTVLEGVREEREKQHGGGPHDMSVGDLDYGDKE